MKKSMVIGFLSFLLVGCSNYSTVVKAHQNDVAEFKIRPIESAKPTANKTFRITSFIFEENAMPGNPEFVKTNTLILPFLVFDYWNHQTQYILGKNQFKAQLEIDLKNAFEIGLSQFGYRISESNPDFEVTIKARKCISKSTYTKSGFFYFALVAYGYNFGGSRGPYESQVILDIETKRGGSSYNSEIEGSAALPFKLFRDDTDSEIERINRSLAISINEAVAKYAMVAPK